MAKYVYSFKEGNREMRSLLGGKGANLGEMTNIGLPVPQGFTITTQACTEFYNHDQKVWKELDDQITEKMHELEQFENKKFGDADNALLVSVRSGAVFSMPGMMDTILNLGLNDETVVGLAKQTGNERFAYDSYRRFIQMFSDVAMEVPKVMFESILEDVKEKYNRSADTDLTAEELKEIVELYKGVYKRELGSDFPQDPKEQLMNSVTAVFRSWNNPRAFSYRNLNGIDHNLGTAVNVQSMVFGNMGETSGTGVAFTRNPADGENMLFGEYLINAQGEDVVAGIRTPEPISRLHEDMPDIYQQFVETTELLEKHYKDMQDIEFTIEKGKLYFLQTRNGKRTAKAALNIAVDLVHEGKITEEEAILRVEPTQINQLLHPNFDEEALKNATPIAKGLPASPGAASGKIYFTAEAVVEAAKAGEKCILVRQETSPEDIDGMHYSEGILTARGGMTSHAAVVARGMGKCCVAGSSEIRVNEEEKTLRYADQTLHEGEVISLNGTTGIVYLGEIKKINVELSGSFEEFMGYADKFRKLKVRTNADTPADAKTAFGFGAEGVGLCRTEHMFFEETRIPKVRRMILASDTESRVKALDELLPLQREDFVGIYEAMEGRPVTVRLLDPPLHEFLPQNKDDIAELAKSMGISAAELTDRVDELHEVNPMLGHRGLRLAVTYPEIYNMQARAIIEAAIEVKAKGLDVKPEIMIPLVGAAKELAFVKANIEAEIQAVLEEKNAKLDYVIGTMMEIPRACLVADQIAQEADFFSFGTNDLTQMTFGFSRDDAGKFIAEYENVGIFEKSPFDTLDVEGVGKLIEIAAEAGRKAKPGLKLGICGEHGGDPDSVKFCHHVGLDYVSCSPYRVPIAKLAAAQAAIDDGSFKDV